MLCFELAFFYPADDCRLRFWGYIIHVQQICWIRKKIRHVLPVLVFENSFSITFLWVCQKNFPKLLGRRKWNIYFIYVLRLLNKVQFYLVSNKITWINENGIETKNGEWFPDGRTKAITLWKVPPPKFDPQDTNKNVRILEASGSPEWYEPQNPKVTLLNSNVSKTCKRLQLYSFEDLIKITDLSDFLAF